MTQITVAVNGMRCGGCARIVVAAIRRLPGVRSAQADPARATAVVLYDSRVTAPHAILHQIESAGFEAFLTTTQWLLLDDDATASS